MRQAHLATGRGISDIDLSKLFIHDLHLCIVFPTVHFQTMQYANDVYIFVLNVQDKMELYRGLIMV